MEGTQTSGYLLLADALLLFHVLLVAFVILGLVAVYLGYFLGWRWVRNRWFRVAHLGIVLFVVVQSWLGAICPLTRWEMYFRAKAGAATYPGDFIGYWLERLLYYDAPAWVFLVTYTVFGIAVLYSFRLVRPS